MNWTKSLATVCTIALLATPAWAQSGRPQQGQRPAGGERPAAMTPEESATAWSWQARSAGRALGLEESTTDTVVEIYGKSRKSLEDALRAAREAGIPGEGQAPAGIGGLGDLAGAAGLSASDMTTAAREQLAAALGGVLDAEQAKAAMASLGTFSRRWDGMTNTIIGFGLDESSTFAALEPVRAYVVELGEVQRSDDRDAMRQASQEASKNLSKGLEATLEPAQVRKVQQSMMRGRPQGGRGGERGGGQRGGGQPATGQRGGDRPGNDSIVSSPAPKAKVGEAAPAFTLKDASGKTHALTDYKGRIVVLQWINPDCPVCRRVSETGRVAAMRREIKALAPDIVHLAINSTNYMEPAVGAAYLKSHDIDAPALDDRNGAVGRLYGAKTTPHMYVIDAEGILRYDGAIDDDTSGRKTEVTNYVVQAVGQIKAGETVAPDKTRSYGCSVKYAK
jgi:peroxiredoxin